MDRRVAMVGSSGGNLYALGGKDPQGLLDELASQLRAGGMELRHVVFVAADRPLDRRAADAPAALWTLRDGAPAVAAEGTLADIDEQAMAADGRLAGLIADGEVDGLVLVSADPGGVNAASVGAAAQRTLPAVGTGGASVAVAEAAGLRLLARSGTTGTTNRTRAVAAASALARHWGLRYRPVIGSPTEASTDSPWRRISLRQIMIASLPAFIAMALLLAISRIPGATAFAEVFDVVIQALPVVVAAVAARQVSGLGEVGLIAGVVTGVMSTEAGILGGVVGGIGAGILAHYLLLFSLARRFPATTANIVAGGLSGLVVGLAVYFGLAPIALAIGEGIRSVISTSVEVSPVLAGGVAGLLIWPAIIAGVYHAAILPIVLLEMERQGNSFFGAIDMVGLVMVSAGITLANVVAPRLRGEQAAAAPGFAINIGFGTFVEAAYPFMFSSRAVFAGAIVSSTAGGVVAGLTGARGTAYVPSVVAPFVSNNPLGFGLAMATGFGLAFVITLAVNRARRPATAAEDGA